ncbi:MAG: PIN domain-containing protein [Actinobacteria bacterium]|nr:PIN domain-containing protein [Actinomycetota bacterium]
MALVALYDANVLYPNTLRDVLIRVAMAGLVRARWTDAILDEVFEHLSANRPDLDPERLDRTRMLMNKAIRDVLVEGYEPRMARLKLPDPDDRHVLAAAIQAKASVIVTSNTKDFPMSVLDQYGIVVQRPDDFLLGLCEDHAPTLRAVIDDIARTWDDPAEVVLASLGASAPETAARLSSL